jgi:hypothetical protein
LNGKLRCFDNVCGYCFGVGFVVVVLVLGWLLLLLLVVVVVAKEEGGLEGTEGGRIGSVR